MDVRRFAITFILILGMFVALDMRDTNRQEELSKENQKRADLAEQRGYDARVAPCLLLMLTPGPDASERQAVATNPPRYCTIPPVLDRINTTLREAGLPEYKLNH